MRVFLKARSHIVAGDEALTCNTREKIFFTILDVIIATSYRVSKARLIVSRANLSIADHHITEFTVKSTVSAKEASILVLRAPSRIPRAHR